MHMLGQNCKKGFAFVHVQIYRQVKNYLPEFLGKNGNILVCKFLEVLWTWNYEQGVQSTNEVDMRPHFSILPASPKVYE